jgi:hypothetical protein
MRRHPAQAELSRDNHKALFVAQRLNRSDASSAQEAADVFREFWRDHGRLHFVAEEDVLLPALAPAEGEERPEVVRTLVEHTAIRRAALELAGEAAPAPEQLHALGRLLHDHVRFEERELFALLEAELDEAALTLLGERVERAERGEHPV